MNVIHNLLQTLGPVHWRLTWRGRPEEDGVFHNHQSLILGTVTQGRSQCLNYARILYDIYYDTYLNMAEFSITYVMNITSVSKHIA